MESNGVAPDRAQVDETGSTEKRPLGIPTVRDRVVQTALKMVVEPIFEREFAAQNYGFRPGRSCKDALRRVDELLNFKQANIEALHEMDGWVGGTGSSIPAPTSILAVARRCRSLEYQRFMGSVLVADSVSC